MEDVLTYYTPKKSSLNSNMLISDITNLSQPPIVHYSLYFFDNYVIIPPGDSPISILKHICYCFNTCTCVKVHLPKADSKSPWCLHGSFLCDNYERGEFQVQMHSIPSKDSTTPSILMEFTRVYGNRYCFLRMLSQAIHRSGYDDSMVFNENLPNLFVPLPLPQKIMDKQPPPSPIEHVTKMLVDRVVTSIYKNVRLINIQSFAFETLKNTKMCIYLFYKNVSILKYLADTYLCSDVFCDDVKRCVLCIFTNCLQHQQKQQHCHRCVVPDKKIYKLLHQCRPFAILLDTVAHDEFVRRAARQFLLVSYQYLN